jgi:hypothetical protein
MRFQLPYNDVVGVCHAEKNTERKIFLHKNTATLAGIYQMTHRAFSLQTSDSYVRRHMVDGPRKRVELRRVDAVGEIPRNVRQRLEPIGKGQTTCPLCSTSGVMARCTARLGSTSTMRIVALDFVELSSGSFRVD